MMRGMVVPVLLIVFSSPLLFDFVMLFRLDIDRGSDEVDMPSELSFFVCDLIRLALTFQFVQKNFRLKIFEIFSSNIDKIKPNFERSQ